MLVDLGGIILGANAVLALSGETVTSLTSGIAAIAEIQVKSDGTVFKDTSTTSPSQIDATTDWIIPNSASGSKTYYIRYTSLVGDALTAAPAAEDAWIAISGTMIYRLVDASAPAGGKTATFTIEISDNASGPALVSASYTLTVDRED